VGRNEPGTHAASVVLELEKVGARITTDRCDVSCEQQVEGVFQRICDRGIPLRGVIHAAGLVDDGVLALQSWQQFEKVMAPKIAGAWNLHQKTLGCDLDFFVLYSTGASLLGSRGQSNYAAANAFLDALSHERKRKGLPSLSVNWGPWAESGMVSRLSPHDAERMKAEGVREISPQQGVLALERLLEGDSVQVAVLDFDWSKYLSHSRGASAQFSEMRRSIEDQHEMGPHANGGSIRAELASCHEGQQRNLLAAHIRRQALAMLGLGPDRAIDERQPLQEMGLDSLMAVELRNALAFSVGIPLPSTLLFDYPNVEALTSFIYQQLPQLLSASSNTQALNEPGSTPENTDVADELAKLSDQEAEALLLRELEVTGDGRHHG
jgi:polyketide synthase 12/myxalamid-type polyketide synthase MxaB